MYLFQHICSCHLAAVLVKSPGCVLKNIKNAYLLRSAIAGGGNEGDEIIFFVFSVALLTFKHCGDSRSTGKRCSSRKFIARNHQKNSNKHLEFMFNYTIFELDGGCIDQLNRAPSQG